MQNPFKKPEIDPDMHDHFKKWMEDPALDRAIQLLNEIDPNETDRLVNSMQDESIKQQHSEMFGGLGLGGIGIVGGKSAIGMHHTAEVLKLSLAASARCDIPIVSAEFRKPISLADLCIDDEFDHFNIPRDWMKHFELSDHSNIPKAFEAYCYDDGQDFGRRVKLKESKTLHGRIRKHLNVSYDKLHEDLIDNEMFGEAVEQMEERTQVSQTIDDPKMFDEMFANVQSASQETLDELDPTRKIQRKAIMDEEAHYKELQYVLNSKVSRKRKANRAKSKAATKARKR